MKRLSWFALLLFIILLALSCKKIQSLSPVPSIEYRSFEVFDTIDPLLGNEYKAGKLRFYFEDGDGDVGLKSVTDGSTDTFDLFFNVYRKFGGIMTRLTRKDTIYSYLWLSPLTIPYMERTGQNKILSGTIDVTFFYLFTKPTDTIMYEFYIKDRALNESNVASTSEIIPSQNKVY